MFKKNSSLSFADQEPIIGLAEKYIERVCFVIRALFAINILLRLILTVQRKLT